MLYQKKEETRQFFWISIHDIHIFVLAHKWWERNSNIWYKICTAMKYLILRPKQKLASQYKFWYLSLNIKLSSEYKNLLVFCFFYSIIVFKTQDLYLIYKPCCSVILKTKVFILEKKLMKYISVWSFLFLWIRIFFFFRWKKNLIILHLIWISITKVHSICGYIVK